MKRQFPLLVFLFATTFVSAQPYSFVANWSLENNQAGGTNQPTYLSAQAMAIGSGLSNVGFIAGNTGLAYASNQWTNGSSIDANDYLQFGVTTQNNGVLLSGTTLTFSFYEDITSQGPATLQVAVSVNGGAYFNVGSAITSGPSGGGYSGHSLNYLLPSNATSVVFRVYGYNAANSGANSTLSIDDVTITANSALPVVLSRFDAVLTDHGVQLEWVTESEADNLLFLIERASENGDFEIIGSVDGAGTSSAAKSYTYTDASVRAGFFYYRLKQVDADGSVQHSPLRSVRVAGDELFVYPTTATDVLHLVVPGASTEEALQWQVLDAAGRVQGAGAINAGAQETALELFHLPAGPYFLNVYGANTRFTQRFFKQ